MKKSNDPSEFLEKLKEENQTLALELRSAQKELKELRQIKLSLCLSCRKIRNPEKYWLQIEQFFSAHGDLLFTYGLCPECAQKNYNKLPVFQESKREESPETKQYLKASEDPLIQKLKQELDNPEEDPETLRQDLAVLIKRYEKLNNRMNKIVTISDSYQLELRDLSIRMELLAHTDVLTGLPNRRDIMERLEMEHNRAERYKSSFSVLLFDVDDFKKINDWYGHDMGDEALKHLAKIFRKSFRRADTCARWGGEEFLVLCPESGEEDTMIAGEKCRSMVCSTTIQLRGETVTLGISGGLCAYVQGMSINDLLRKVDEALYEAKRLGKNRIISSTYFNS